MATLCPVCDGTGLLLGEPCPLCLDEAYEPPREPTYPRSHALDFGRHRSALCLVLDIDGTLLSESVPLAATASQYRRCLRPHLHEFLDFAFESFCAVGIWTAASREWLQLFTTSIDPHGQRPWAFTWSGRLSLGRLDFSTDHFFPVRSREKRLSKIWKNRSLRARGYTRRSTIIIDNTPEVCRCNFGNAIYISTYDGDGEQHDTSDDALLILISYLKHLIQKHNSGISVRCIEKRGWHCEGMVCDALR